MTDVQKAMLLLTKPLSDDGSGFRYGLEPEASLPLIQNTLTVACNTTRLCWFFIILWECCIHANAVRALSVFIYLFLSNDLSGMERLSWL